MIFSKEEKGKDGFTLIEMMVAVSIFAIIMTISMGALLNIINLNRKSQSVKTIMNNLNFALEEMSRDIRFGYNYCEGLDACRNTDAITFKFKGIRDSLHDVTYYAQSQTVGDDNDCKQIMKKTSIDLVGNPITAPEVCIKNLAFTAFNPSNTDASQARVLITLGGYAGTGKTQTVFNLQTTVTERQLDIK